MQGRALNIAYIGNGKSANRYHIPYVLTRQEKFRIKAIEARHIDHTAWSEVPGVAYTTDLEGMLNDPEVDIIEVTTPSDLHFEMAKKALEAGKHVTVDKPFAAPSDACRQAARRCQPSRLRTRLALPRPAHQLVWDA